MTMCPNRQNDRGASAVELAILTPLLAMLLVGAVQLGLMFNRSQDLEAAAREGARYASDDDARTKTDIISHVNNALENTSGVTVTISPDVDNPCDGREGDAVTVTLSVTEPLDLLFVATVDIDLGASADFICSNNRATS